MQERRTELTAEGAKIPSHAALFKEAAPLYQSLPQSERESLQAQADQQRANYPATLNEWLESLTPSQIKEENLLRSRRRKAGKSHRANLKVPGAPKAPLTGFMRFSVQLRRERPEELEGETSITKQSGIVARAWKALTDEERKVSSAVWALGEWGGGAVVLMRFWGCDAGVQ